MRCSLLLFLVLACHDIVLGLDNGLALTPPMGWLSWERFGCNIDCDTFPDTCISETLYLDQARRLASDGYRDAGYKYVNVDDCWSELERSNEGKIVADRKRFPNGLAALSKRIHEMGLLFGLYGDIGSKTCAGYPGFEGYYESDAETFANEYEIDSLKVDGCHGDVDLYGESYPAFGRALNKTGRPIIYSCSWPAYLEDESYGEDPDVLNHGIKQNCNIWRNYKDIFDDWSAVIDIANRWTRRGPNDVLVRAAGPGHFNDPDMILVGNPGLSISEQKAQFALWAIFAAPLLVSADLRTISDESRDILLNKEIINVNQDPLGRQGWCAQGATTLYRVYVRELLPSDGVPCPPGESDTWAVVLANFNDIFERKMITFDPKQHLPNGSSWETFKARDLYLHTEEGSLMKSLTVPVDESSVRMFIVAKETTTTVRQEKQQAIQ